MRRAIPISYLIYWFDQNFERMAHFCTNFFLSHNLLACFFFALPRLSQYQLDAVIKSNIQIRAINVCPSPIELNRTESTNIYIPFRYVIVKRHKSLTHSQSQVKLSLNIQSKWVFFMLFFFLLMCMVQMCLIKFTYQKHWTTYSKLIEKHSI